MSNRFSSLRFALGFVLAAAAAPGCLFSQPLGKAPDSSANSDASSDGGSCVRSDGVVFNAGDSFPSADGCNTCSCDASGQIACTLRACADGGGFCVDSTGVARRAGETFPAGDHCNTCTCTESGTIACTRIACQDGGAPSDGGGGSGAECRSSAECPSNEFCAGETEGCAIPWHCRSAPIACATNSVAYCTCRGVTVYGSGTTGCAPEPFAHRGACEATDGGSAPSEDGGANGGCVRTGCSGQICADGPRGSTCEWTAEYACYASAACERQSDGSCGFTPSAALTTCIDNARRDR